jgi:hypothetical protein
MSYKNPHLINRSLLPKAVPIAWGLTSLSQIKGIVKKVLALSIFLNVFDDFYSKAKIK